MNNQLEVIKTAFKDKKKRTQNLILLVILLVVLLFSCNYIFKVDGKDKSSSNSTSNKSNINNNSNTENTNNTNNTKNTTNNSDLEEKLSIILSQIQGISDVSIVLSYSQEEKQNVVYNTKEEQSDGKNTTEKVVAYNEQSGSKSAIIESVECPKVEGAIVVAKGANSVDIRSKIATAVSTVVNIPVYKVQVFEKQG